MYKQGDYQHETTYNGWTLKAETSDLLQGIKSEVKRLIREGSPCRNANIIDTNTLTVVAVAEKTA